jgi:L-asparaginase / beta-aspartyl-peptidase
MLVVASTNGRVGIEASMTAMRRGGSALDAVEAGIRLVEENPLDSSVGYAGLPNFVGEVELDASIMDGHNLAAGAVGALKGYVNAITVARKVMEELPHVFLAGDGAARFAAELGLERRDLLTEESRRIWLNGLTGHGLQYSSPEFFESVRKWVKITADPEMARETVNFIAVDAQHNLATGVSTSGWAWKYPGRLGDSPVIGAGNYADNRYGAAACTGRGEMAIRLCTAHSVVLYRKQGMSLAEACREAMLEIRDLPDEYHSRFSMIAATADEQHLAVTNFPGATYLYQTDRMTEPAEAERVFVS